MLPRRALAKLRVSSKSCSAVAAPFACTSGGIFNSTAGQRLKNTEPFNAFVIHFVWPSSMPSLMQCSRNVCQRTINKTGPPSKSLRHRRSCSLRLVCRYLRSAKLGAMNILFYQRDLVSVSCRRPSKLSLSKCHACDGIQLCWSYVASDGSCLNSDPGDSSTKGGVLDQPARGHRRGRYSHASLIHAPHQQLSELKGHRESVLGCCWGSFRSPQQAVGRVGHSIVVPRNLVATNYGLAQASTTDGPGMLDLILQAH